MNPEDLEKLHRLFDDFSCLDQIEKELMRQKLIQVLKNFESSVLHCFKQIASKEHDEVARMAAQKAYWELVNLFGRDV